MSSCKVKTLPMMNERFFFLMTKHRQNNKYSCKGKHTPITLLFNQTCLLQDSKEEGMSNLASQLGQIGWPSLNVLNLILKSPIFVPFGAYLAKSGCQSCHPCNQVWIRDVNFASKVGQIVTFVNNGRTLGFAGMISAVGQRLASCRYSLGTWANWPFEIYVSIKKLPAYRPRKVSRTLLCDLTPSCLHISVNLHPRLPRWCYVIKR